METQTARVSRSDEALLLGSCGVALTTLVVVACHQLGALEHLPDPPSRLFDSDRITGSKAAHPLGVPDSVPGLASYSTTLALILLAERERQRDDTLGTVGILLGLKLVADMGLALGSTVRSVVQFGKLCSWCTGTALATGVMAYAGRHYIVRSLKAAGNR